VVVVAFALELGIPDGLTTMVEVMVTGPALADASELAGKVTVLRTGALLDALAVPLSWRRTF